MKILEIVDTKFSSAKYKGRFRDNSEEYFSDKPNVLGAGLFSKAVHDKKDSHMVRKSHTAPDAGDGFVPFAEYLAKSGYMDHPNLPKIYEIRDIEDRAGSRVYSYTIEQLLPYSKFSVKALIPIAEKTFKMDAFTEKDLSSSKALTGKFGSILADAVAYGDTRDIIDDNVIVACGVLRNFLKTFDGAATTLDLHSGNLMYRRTPYGLQLVISDPFV